MKKLLALLLVAVMCVGILASCGNGNSDDDETQLLGMSDSLLPIDESAADFTVSADFKIGFICLHDENSTYDKNFLDAAARMKKALNLSDSQVVIKTNIPEGDECRVEAEAMAAAGCKIVFANSFGHEDFMIAAAEKYPNVQFCHATGTKAHTANLPNYSNAFASIYEGRYLAGIVAGLKLNEMIEEGKITTNQAVIGYVGAFTYAEVISGYTSFYLGAKSVCPSVTMKVSFTGSWYDQTKEQEAAQSLMADGCVLISQHADSMGAPAACEAAGVPNVSYNGSTYEACPETFMISSAINWTPYFLYLAKCVANGQDIADDWCGGIAEGSVVITGMNQDIIADGTITAIEAAIAQFKAGTLKVFDTSKFTVGGSAISPDHKADVDTDANYAPDTDVVENGIFVESKYRSAPYFDLRIDGITLLNEKY
jgi:basic membrane protein A